MTTELVKSISIDNLVNQRAAVIERLQIAVATIREAAEISRAAGLGMPRFALIEGYSRNSRDITINDGTLGVDRAGARNHLEGRPVDDALAAIRRGVDAAAWQHLMHESGLRSLMDAAAREKWDRSISEGDFPELTKPNIESTFGMLYEARGDMFERGVIACFKSLSWHYKTNLPQKFGKRIVIRHLRGSITPGQWGGGGTSLGHPNYQRCDSLDDLERVLTVLDGKPEPDHRRGWYSRLIGSDKTTEPPIQSDYLSVRSFRNGNAHVTFRRLDLVERMNKIIAKHYPGALPAPK